MTTITVRGPTGANAYIDASKIVYVEDQSHLRAKSPGYNTLISCGVANDCIFSSEPAAVVHERWIQARQLDEERAQAGTKTLPNGHKVMGRQGL